MSFSKKSITFVGYNKSRRGFLRNLISGLITFTFFKNKSWSQIIPFSFWKNSSGGGGATSGLLFSWGSSNSGVLGDGTTVNKSSPVQIGALTDWKGLADHYSTAIEITKSNGGLWAFGINGMGTLGIGSGATNKSSPVQVGALTNWKQVSGGFYNIHTVKTDGTLWGWGSSFGGSLGNGVSTNNVSEVAPSPIQIGALTNWKSVSVGFTFSLAVKTDGTLWAWGVNESGQLGNNESQINYSVPVQVGAAGEWAQVDFYSAGAFATGAAAITATGAVKTWGQNSLGELGDGTTIDKSSPISVGSLTNWSKISSGSSFSLVIKTDGTLWGWGDNGSGQLGTGNATNSSSPVQVGALTTWSQISCAGSYSLAVRTDGTLWAWGDNVDGQLGLGNITNKSSPVQVGALTTWSQVATSSSTSGNQGHRGYAVKTDGTLWAWGINGSGGLGDNTTTDKSSPIQVGSLTNWTGNIGAGNDHILVVKTDGTLWAWGSGASGKLGDNTSTNKSSPIQIGALTNWSKVAAGSTHSLAMKTDGTLWSWGGNVYGQLGLGDLTIRSSPVQVGSNTNWVFINAKENSSLAVNSLGELYVFGQNSNNIAFGLNLNLPNRSSPIQIGALTDWATVSAGKQTSLATKTDGTLWAWGLNSSGQLGLGHTTNISSPVQVGAMTDWSSVANGVQGTSSAAIKTDGTLWTWGANGSGQLGHGNITSRLSPVQVGTLTNWKKVSFGISHCASLKTDGTLWTWGLNSSGQLGKGDTTNRSSPVQVGTETTWLDMSVGDNTTYGVRS